MTYPILNLPSLTAAQRASATALLFAKYVPSDFVPWDLLAQTSSSLLSAMSHSLFSFTAIEGYQYDIFSTSYLDPSLVVYDSLGQPIAIDTTSSSSHTPGQDYVARMISPYSGTMYVDAGWNQINNELGLPVSLKVYADVRTPPPPPKPVSSMTGTASADSFVATRIEDRIDGRGGIDTVQFAGKRGEYSIVRDGDTLTVTSLALPGDADTLRSIEKLAFADSSYDTPYADLTQSLYVAYFGRAADVGGLKSFQAQLATLGAPANVNDFSARYATDPAVKNLIDSFGLSAESTALYSGDNKDFVKAIYNNLLNRETDQPGLEFWSKAIDSGSLTRANASLSILAGAQSNTSPQGLTDALLLQKKISIASNFTLFLETQDKGVRYDGAGPAALARKLLGAVTTTTDALDFQQDVIIAVKGLPPVTRGAPGHAGEFAAAPGDAPVIELTGAGSIADAFLFA